VSQNEGPGVLGDINSSMDIAGPTISGNQSEGIPLVHQIVLDLGVRMVFAGNGGAAVTCDNTSLLLTSEKHPNLCWNVRAADFSVPEAGPSIPVVPSFSGKMEEYKRFRARIPRSKN
jgi:hypothetical protein